MKAVNFLLLSALFLATASAFASEDDGYGEEYCSAELERLDGSMQTLRVECDGSYAGKCLKEAYSDSSKKETHWEVVECR